MVAAAHPLEDELIGVLSSFENRPNWPNQLVDVSVASSSQDLLAADEERLNVVLGVVDRLLRFLLCQGVFEIQGKDNALRFFLTIDG